MLVTGVYLAHFWRAGYDRFYHDAATYWELGRLFGDDAAFSLVAFDDPLRSYALPLLYFLLQSMAGAIDVGDVTIVRFAGSLLAATLGVVVAPRLARAIFPGADTSWPRVLALNGIVFVLWRDHFQFPLSDFPALLAASIAVIGLLRRTPAGYLLAGAGLGVAALIRPFYAPFVLVAVVAAASRSAGWRTRVTALVLVLAPLVALSLPQVAVNHHHRGDWTPTLPAARTTTLGNLTWGLQVQKHETYVGPPETYPSESVLYLDPTTDGVIDDDTLPIESYAHYARVVLEHPVPMVASYALHAFNGFDVRYPTPFVRDLRDRSPLLPLLQLTVLFLAFVQLAFADARRRLGPISWIGIAILAGPALVAIPFAMEPRYFLGVHLLAYVLVCFSPALRASLFHGNLVRPLGVGLAYLIFLVAGMTLSAATHDQLQHPLGSESSRATYLRSRISSGPARATTTNPSRSSSGRTSGTARRTPSSPVKIVPTCCPST